MDLVLWNDEQQLRIRVIEILRMHLEGAGCSLEHTQRPRHDLNMQNNLP